MDYSYGTRPDQVDEFFRRKRPWSVVKDTIVGNYVRCYLKTVQNLLRTILIVDGFSGPGIFGDDSDGSPLIMCNAIGTIGDRPRFPADEISWAEYPPLIVGAFSSLAALGHSNNRGQTTFSGR